MRHAGGDKVENKGDDQGGGDERLQFSCVEECVGV